MNAWSYTSTPLIRLHGVVLTFKKKHRETSSTLQLHVEGVKQLFPTEITPFP